MIDRSVYLQPIDPAIKIIREAIAVHHFNWPYKTLRLELLYRTTSVVRRFSSCEEAERLYPKI